MQDTRLDTRLPCNPLITASLRNWFRELEGHLTDLRGVLEALGLVLILLARTAPETRPALTSDECFERKLSEWTGALGELLAVDLENGRNGGAR